jgi:serine/threonine protein kinase
VPAVPPGFVQPQAPAFRKRRKEIRQFRTCSVEGSGFAAPLHRHSLPARHSEVSTLTKAGRYDLREELGRGAMGVVYHGFDPVIGRDVAVKTLRLSEAGTGMSREELISRFQTEARAAGVLTHPNIVVVFDAGEEGGLFYITMEFVEGRSLQAVIDAQQPFALPRVMKIMEQVCSALDFAHQHNVVHRDIKPANLMLTADDTVKITDFGTAKILQFGTAQTAHVMGTPSYMSPEQVKGKPVDGRSDIFSLGVILYELMTGEKPFPGQNISTVIYKIINEDPIPPRSLDSSIHPGLSAVITQALAKDPNARFQSCHELIHALKNYHEMLTPERTLRMTPIGSENGAAASQSSSAAARPALAAPTPRTTEAKAPAPIFSPVLQPAEAPKSGGRVLLTFLLLGVIGYAGYRVYPPLLDLWQRAHQAVPAQAVPASRDSAPAASPEAANAAPDAKPSDSAQTAAPPAGNTPATGENHPQQDTEQLTTSAAVPAKATVPALPPVGSAEKPIAAPKPAAPAVVSPAQKFESKLRAELSGSPLGGKVKMQATANALTLSGTLSVAEYRELSGHLQAIPTGVRLIDHVEYAEGQQPTSGSASTGSVWVRSAPPGARILVDGMDTGLRTPSQVELRPGEHRVLLALNGFALGSHVVVVRAGEATQFTETLQPR